MPEGNAVEVGENGDQIRPNRPEHHCEQRDHHQHGDAQRLLVDLLESDSWLFLRLGAFRPFLHQMLTARQRAAPGDTPRRHAQAAQHGLVQQVPDHHQIHGLDPASRQTQRRVEVAGCRQHHQGHRNDRQHRDRQQAQAVRLFIAPAFPAHRPNQHRDQQ